MAKNHEKTQMSTLSSKIYIELYFGIEKDDIMIRSY